MIFLLNIRTNIQNFFGFKAPNCRAVPIFCKFGDALVILEDQQSLQMKTRNILILCTAFLVSMPSADAQSLKEGLKSIGDKIGKQIVKTAQSVKKQTTGSKTSDKDKALQKQYDAMMGNVSENGR